MSDDMRLLTLTHLRAALERRDWGPVKWATTLCIEQKGYAAYCHQCDLTAARLEKNWRAVEAVYTALGGVGAGEPPKGAGDPATGRHVGVLDANARGPDGWASLENVR